MVTATIDFYSKTRRIHQNADGSLLSLYVPASRPGGLELRRGSAPRLGIPLGRRSLLRSVSYRLDARRAAALPTVPVQNDIGLDRNSHVCCCSRKRDLRGGSSLFSSPSWGGRREMPSLENPTNATAVRRHGGGRKGTYMYIQAWYAQLVVLAQLQLIALRNGSGLVK